MIFSGYKNSKEMSKQDALVSKMNISANNVTHNLKLDNEVNPENTTKLVFMSENEDDEDDNEIDIEVEVENEVNEEDEEDEEDNEDNDEVDEKVNKTLIPTGNKLYEKYTEVEKNTLELQNKTKPNFIKPEFQGWFQISQTSMDNSNILNIQPNPEYRFTKKVNVDDVVENKIDKSFKYEKTIVMPLKKFNVEEIQPSLQDNQPIFATYRLPSKINSDNIITNLFEKGRENHSFNEPNVNNNLFKSNKLLSMVETFDTTRDTKRGVFTINGHTIYSYNTVEECQYNTLDSFYNSVFTKVVTALEMGDIQSGYKILYTHARHTTGSLLLNDRQTLELIDIIIDCIPQNKNWCNAIENKNSFCKLFDLLLTNFETNMKFEHITYTLQLALVEACKLKSNNMWIIKYILKKQPNFLDASILSYISEDNELSYKLVVKYLEKKGIKIPEKKTVVQSQPANSNVVQSQPVNSNVVQSQSVNSNVVQSQPSEANVFKFEINGKTIKLETDKDTDLTFTVRSRDMKNNQKCLIEVY